MILINELLNYNDWKLPDVYGFTSNSVITKNGLVMGGGAALAMKRAVPESPILIAKAMDYKNNSCDAIKVKEDKYIFWFRTKKHYKDFSSLKLITQSTNVLNELAHRYKQLTFHLNAPGIGLGGLKWEDVLPIIEILPDNVRIYK